MLRLVDTHCHLDFADFLPDREEVLQRSAAVGVNRWVVPGVDLKTSLEAVELASSHPGIYAAVGVHPTAGPSGQAEEIKALQPLGMLDKVVAIGEIGLDNYHTDVSPQAQRARFDAHLELAAKIGKPVIIHSREAIKAILDRLGEWVSELQRSGSSLAERPGILHAFEGSAEDARRAWQLGFCIGLGGPLTYPKAEEKRASARAVPLEAIVLETDAPFLAPLHRRGQRNEPSAVAEIAAALADLLDLSIEQVAETTTRNAAKIFAWRDMD